MLTAQALVGPGDRVVVVTPEWPNLVEIPKIHGAHSVTFALTFAPSGWKLDLDRFLATLTPDTRAVIINSPNNPTGWRLGWIAMPVELSANMGTLIEYNTSCAPSFIQHAGVVAIEKGEDIVRRFNSRLRHARDFLLERLQEGVRRLERALHR